MDLELWHFPISHYNEKVRWALDWKGLAHRRRVLSWNYLPVALWKTGQGKLPVLLIDGTPYADSTRIIAEVERRQPEPPLYPADPAARARALGLEDFFDEHVGHAVRAVVVGPLLFDAPRVALDVLTTGMPPSARRIMGSVLPAFRAFYVRRHAIARDTLQAERARVVVGLDRIVGELQPSGYLVGDAFSVADLTAAALLSPLVQPAELEFPTPGPLPEPQRAYLDTLAAHPAVAWVRDMYRRHRRSRTASMGNERRRRVPG